MNSQINLVDQFLSNPHNAQMVEETIENRKSIIFANMVAWGMIVSSPDAPMTASPQDPLNSRCPYNNLHHDSKTINMFNYQ